MLKFRMPRDKLALSVIILEDVTKWQKLTPGILFPSLGSDGDSPGVCQRRDFDDITNPDFARLSRSSWIGSLIQQYSRHGLSSEKVLITDGGSLVWA
jgi:hypothetical protein